MFSQLTLTVFRIFFTYFTTWNTPFQWNNQRLELEYTINKSQLLRWRMSSVFQIFYTLFIYFRLYQFHIQGDNSINELILQIPFLCAFAGGFSAVVTVLQQSKEIVLVFNQMSRNNYTFGKHVVLKKWDTFGIFIAIAVTCITSFPYVCAIFFFVNRHGTNFLYSLIDTSGLPKPLQIGVFIIFLWIEIISLYAVCNNFVTLLIVVASFYIHCTYWMSSNLKSLQPLGNKIYKIFPIFTLHTQRFNEIISIRFLAPMKEIAGAAIIFPAFAIILYHSELGFAAMLLLGFTFASGVTIVFALIFPAGWVWKYSVKTKCSQIATNDTSDAMNKRIRNSLSPFGITIGSFYIIKNYTVMSFFDILLRYLSTLLITFKEKSPNMTQM